ncbi:aa3-type cytochrome c oxidase subunit IV [Kordiimonas marina]|nr:aa3-type cytochrome c oxidase subunit IV [Kordiimonas marina]MCJ9430288.1 aa3-type cytochrome c oxidase subunit IV [Kordiimonas marina]
MMEIQEQEQTYHNFLKYATRGLIAGIVLLVFLAMIA